VPVGDLEEVTVAVSDAGTPAASFGVGLDTTTVADPDCGGVIPPPPPPPQPSAKPAANTQAAANAVPMARLRRRLGKMSNKQIAASPAAKLVAHQTNADIAPAGPRGRLRLARSNQLKMDLRFATTMLAEAGDGPIVVKENMAEPLALFARFIVEGVIVHVEPVGKPPPQVSITVLLRLLVGFMVSVPVPVWPAVSTNEGRALSVKSGVVTCIEVACDVTPVKLESPK